MIRLPALGCQPASRRAQTRQGLRHRLGKRLDTLIRPGQLVVLVAERRRVRRQLVRRNLVLAGQRVDRGNPRLDVGEAGGVRLDVGGVAA